MKNDSGTATARLGKLYNASLRCIIQFDTSLWHFIASGMEFGFLNIGSQ